MIKVPKQTIEKPLTAIDYIAELEGARSIDEVRNYAARVPLEARQDDRFTRAVQKRLAAIKGGARAATRAA